MEIRHRLLSIFTIYALQSFFQQLYISMLYLIQYAHVCSRSNWTLWSCWRAAPWKLAKKTKWKLAFFNSALYSVLIIHTTARCLKLHTDVPHNTLKGPHPVCFPFVSVWNLCCALTIFRGLIKCAVLFVRSCRPMRCPSVMDWINGLRMKPASFCLFSLTLGSPSYWECEVMSLLAHQEVPFIITSFW